MSGHSPRSSERKRSKRSSIFDRIDGGDRQRVADGAVGGRAAPLGEDPLAPAELHDVPDDQEVAGEVELLDQVELLLDLRLGPGGQRPEAGAGAVPGDVAQVGGGRLAGRQRILGEAVAEVGQGEVEPLRPARALAARASGRSAKRRAISAALFRCRSRWAASRLPAASRVGVVADRRQHVVERLVLRPGVAHAVGGEQRQAELAGEVDQGLVAVLLVAQAVALELDVEAAAEEVRRAARAAAGRRRRRPRPARGRAGPRRRRSGSGAPRRARRGDPRGPAPPPWPGRGRRP